MLTRLVTTAVTNARRGAADLARSNTDRRLLQPSIDDNEIPVPGELRRLGREECLQLLASRRVGRFAYVASARALDVVPVNYVCRTDGTILFRSGPGPKLSAADRRDVVAFQVDDINDAGHAGWSVLVTGRARRLSAADLAELHDLPTPWASGPRRHVVLIEPTRIEGRRLS